MIRRLGSHAGRKIVFGYDRYLSDELESYMAALAIHGEVSLAVDADSLHYLSSAQRVCEAMQADADEVSWGILCCGTGLGMSIAANKFRGIYAARCVTVEDAEMARSINNANVLCLAAKNPFETNRAIIDAFVQTPYAGRKLDQLETIAHLELESRPSPSVPVSPTLRVVRRLA